MSFRGRFQIVEMRDRTQGGRKRGRERGRGIGFELGFRRRGVVKAVRGRVGDRRGRRRRRFKLKNLNITPKLYIYIYILYEKEC